MRSFFVQLGWELRRMALRRQTWVAFALALAFELLASVLLTIPAVRGEIARNLWKMHEQWDGVFSGLTTAVHIIGESYSIPGVLGMVLVGAAILGAEMEDGTLRLLLSRRTARSRVLALKLSACAVYAGVAAGFIMVSSLAVCLCFEGPGNLFFASRAEGVAGVFDFGDGLARFAVAFPLLWFSGFSAMLWPCFFSCTGMKPSIAATLALALMAGDDIVRSNPETAAAAPYCLSTRMLSWRQVFNAEIPWARIQRNELQLAEMDLALIAGAWIAFRRRED